MLVLDGMDLSPTKTWYRVRLPILPNNSTGWVPAQRARRPQRRCNTHLYVDRAKLTRDAQAQRRHDLQDDHRRRQPYWPTPRGEYYIRDKLTNFDNPFYGPVAFGTSARSATLTDWPGGGFVGVHGTNEPQILPAASRTAASACRTSRS